MHVTSCEVRGVDRYVDHQDRRQGRHQDVDHQLVLLRQVRHQDVDHQNQDELHLGRQDVGHQDRQGDHRGQDVRQGQDVCLDQDANQDLDVRLGQGGILMDHQLDVNQEPCADLEEAELDDQMPTSDQVVAELDDPQGERLAACPVAYLEAFHQDDPAEARGAALAAD